MTTYRQHARRVVLPDGRRALVIETVIPDDAPPAVREGLARRAIVNSGGICPCGARMHLPNRAERRRSARTGEVLNVTIEHESGCPAATSAILAALRRSP